MLTKSGGNVFHGMAFGYNSGGALQAENSTAADLPATSTTVSNLDWQWDYGGTLGGYVVKDKLWFFGSYAHMFQRQTTEMIRDLTALGSPAIGTTSARGHDHRHLRRQDHLQAHPHPDADGLDRRGSEQAFGRRAFASRDPN